MVLAPPPCGPFEPPAALPELPEWWFRLPEPPLPFAVVAFAVVMRRPRFEPGDLWYSDSACWPELLELCWAARIAAAAFATATEWAVLAFRFLW